MPVPIPFMIATAAGKVATSQLMRQAVTMGTKKFIQTYGTGALTALGFTSLSQDTPKKEEPLKYIPGIHGPKTKEQEEIEKIGTKETFPAQEDWAKSFGENEGLKIPEPEKETPPVNIPPEIKTDTGTPIPEQKTWKDYILTQTKAKDITEQTKELVPEKPEFGKLTETETQTAKALNEGKPDFYSRAIAAITNTMQYKYTKGKWKSIVQSNSTKEEMDYLGLTEFLKGNESITKQELLKFVEKKDIAPNITVRSIPKDEMNKMYEGYSLGGHNSGTQEHIVFQIGKDDAKVGQLFKSEHYDTEYGTGNFAWARVQVGYSPADAIVDKTGYNPNLEEDLEKKENINLRELFDNTLIIDEIQSDWLQKGQDEGFVSDYDIVPEDKLIEYFKKNKIFYKLSEVDGDPVIEWQQSGPIEDGTAPLRSFLDPELNPDYIFNKSDKTHYETLDAGLINQSGTNDPIAYLIYRGKVPDFPIKESKKWVALVLNKMIEKAVLDGRDSIAITNGQIQANRYEAMDQEKKEGLKKFYDKIVFKQLEKIANKYNVELERIDITSQVATKEEEDNYLDQSLQRALDANYKLKKVSFQFLWDRTKDTAIPGHATLYSDGGRGQGANYIGEYLTNFHPDWNKIRNNEVYVWVQERDISQDIISWELPIVIESHAANHAPELQGNDLELYKKYLKDHRPPPGQEPKEEQLIKMKLPKKLQKESLSKPIKLTKKIDEQTQKALA